MSNCLLILDDDAAVAATIRLMAERLGFEVHAAYGAAQFFELYYRVRPSHCLLDLVLPEVDGMQVIDELARSDCRAEIIITTGAGERVLDAARRAAREYGLVVLGTLPKPFSSQALKALLDHGPDHLKGDLADAPAGPELGLAPVSEDDLIEAITFRQIEPAYQPKIRCKDGQVVGFEALARWRHPAKGLIPPIQFIPLAEKCGLIDEITRIIAEGAMRFFAEERALDELSVAINLSGSSLGDTDLADWLARMSASAGLEPKRMILEITETSAFADPLITLSQATRLRLKGFALSIDDFGVGYSSLVQLARLPFSELKVDMSFVQTLRTSRESQKIVKAIIDLGHSLGLCVTAEGVEDEPTLQLLATLRCDLAQGYSIAKPMNNSGVIEWLNRQRKYSFELDKDYSLSHVPAADETNGGIRATAGE